MMSITRLDTWAVFGSGEKKMPHGPLHHRRQCAKSGHPSLRITQKCRGLAPDGWCCWCWFSWSVLSSTVSISSTSPPSSSVTGRRSAMLEEVERASTAGRWTPHLSAPWCCLTPTSWEPWGDTGLTSWGGRGCHFCFVFMQSITPLLSSVLRALQECKQKQAITLTCCLQTRTGNGRWRGLSRPLCGCSSPK